MSFSQRCTMVFWISTPSLTAEPLLSLYVKKKETVTVEYILIAHRVDCKVQVTSMGCHVCSLALRNRKLPLTEKISWKIRNRRSQKKATPPEACSACFILLKIIIMFYKQLILFCTRTYFPSTYLLLRSLITVHQSISRSNNSYQE